MKLCKHSYDVMQHIINEIEMAVLYFHSPMQVSLEELKVVV